MKFKNKLNQIQILPHFSRKLIGKTPPPMRFDKMPFIIYIYTKHPFHSVFFGGPQLWHLTTVSRCPPTFYTIMRDRKRTPLSCHDYSRNKISWRRVLATTLICIMVINLAAWCAHSSIYWVYSIYRWVSACGSRGVCLFLGSSGEEEWISRSLPSSWVGPFKKFVYEMANIYMFAKIAHSAIATHSCRERWITISVYMRFSRWGKSQRTHLYPVERAASELHLRWIYIFSVAGRMKGDENVTARGLYIYICVCECGVQRLRVPPTQRAELWLLFINHVDDDGNICLEWIFKWPRRDVRHPREVKHQIHLS